jgi:uncharacterized protein with GYD domain
MPTYVTLLKWTDQGIRNVKETVSRGQQFRQMVEQAGGRLTALYWTQGAYDIMAALECPDEDAAMALLLRLGMLGNVRSETLRAFSEQDMQRILQKLP